MRARSDKVAQRRNEEGLGLWCVNEGLNASMFRKSFSHICADCAFQGAVKFFSIIAWFLFFAFLTLCLYARPTFAATPEHLIAEGVREYTDGLGAADRELRVEHFYRARRLFRQTIEVSKVDNADLYMNLGNAALQCEALGEAILAFRRALLIEPGDQRARQNLIYSRRLLPDWVPRPSPQTLLDTFFFWHRTLSRSGRALAAAFCFAAAAILAATAIRWKMTWARNAALASFTAWLVLVGLALWEHSSRSVDEAVITVPHLIARTADSPGAAVRFAEPLPAGTEVRILDRRHGWLRVRLFNNRDGWVRASGVTELRDRDSTSFYSRPADRLFGSAVPVDSGTGNH